MIGSIADEVPVRLQFVVVPGGGGDENVGELADHLFRAMAFVGVLSSAVLHIASAGIQERRVSLRHRHHVRSHVMGDRFDMAGHRRWIADLDLLRIDFAFGSLVDHIAQKMPPISEMIRRRHARQRIFGHRVVVPVKERLAQFAARIFRMRRLVHVDVDHLVDNTN